ncbi:cytochrome P450 [Spongiactinospora sp. TRM90649]|uniref:cytochrome P450 n=1 Tax=Spongiactinospora sp. TRM90649 TaxID=3031114 RepID=UPI0023F6E1DB|nr:cytochrome P450 [Spongiactinospora sp. TRM90649]MDF5753662.1 cytochrome P450 [Spongiactinospora sp. TRM90649]
MTETDTLPAYPFAAGGAFYPPVEFGRLRTEEPVARVRLPSGQTAWVVSRYADVRQIMTDPRFSKAAMTTPGAPRIMPIQGGSRSLVMTDPPDHTRLRKIVVGSFSSRRIEALRPKIEELTGDCAERMENAGPPADLVAHLALPLPVAVVSEMLGIPPVDRERFRQWTDDMLTVGVPTPDTAQRIKAAVGRLMGFIRGVIAQKPPEGDADLLTVLGQAHRDGRMTEEEMLTMAVMVLVAGYHTTTSSITHGLFHLLREPERFRRLGDSPELIPAAVEELLRFSQIGFGAGSIRMAVEDVEVAGTLIKAGEVAIPLFNSANRDGAIFDDPETLEMTRADNSHMTFGHGIHFCLGAQLARAEMQIVIAELARRFPGLRLAEDEHDIAWESGLAFARPASLALTW